MSLYETLNNHADDRAQRDGSARYGVVSAVDPANHAVKVIVQPDGIESGWIPDPGLAAGSLRIACPCEMYTHVKLTFVEGDAEHPVISGRLFDTTTMPPVSPVTGKSAQAGEFLIVAGNAGASGSGQTAASTQTFFHITPTQVSFGFGENVLTISASGLTIGCTGIDITSPLITTSGDLNVKNGATGSFTTPTGQTVTIRDGLITNIY